MLKKHLGKKGSFEQLNVMIIGVVLVALLLGIGLTILGATKTTIATIQPTAVTNAVTNETDAYVNTTGYTLIESSQTGFRSPVITAIWGEEGGEYNVSYAVGNASVTSLGVVTNTSTAISNASLSYTYVYDSNYSEGYNSTETIVTALSTVPTWIPILVVVFIAGVILVLVTRWSGGKRSGM